MWFAFERFLGIVAHWMRTGQWRGEEFQVRRSRTVTVLAWVLVSAWFLLCIYIAIDQA